MRALGGVEGGAEGTDDVAARTATMLHPIGSPKAPVAMAPVTTVRGSMLMPTQMENSERTVPVRSVSGIGMMCRVSNWMRV